MARGADGVSPRGWPRSAACSGPSPGSARTWWRPRRSTAGLLAFCGTSCRDLGSRRISSTSPTWTRCGRPCGRPPGSSTPRRSPTLTTAVADLRKLAELAHDSGALLVVDSTLAPPVICLLLEHGADLVIHSATKYIGGHSDATGGVVTGRIELISSIRGGPVDTGGSLSPDEAFLLRRGLETLPLRVRRACSTASVFAAALSRHPAVLRIDYPGLPEHSGHQVARRLFDAGPEGVRFGAIVTVTPHGGREAGMAFADKLRLSQLATSLGGTHTVVNHHQLHHAPAAGRPGAGGRGHRPGGGTLLHRPRGRRGSPFLMRMSPWRRSAGPSLGCSGLSGSGFGPSGLRGLRDGEWRTCGAVRSGSPWCSAAAAPSTPCPARAWGLILSVIIVADRYRGAAHRHRHGRALGAHLGRPRPAGAVLRVGAVGRVGDRGRRRDRFGEGRPVARFCRR